jgi:sterol 3beta-glucosyltransferase
MDSGDAPVCVSFGSMLNRVAQKTDHIISESLRQTGNRGIILSGWSDLNKSSSNEMLYMDAVPHQWLLPRCKMIIHHGGAGTTAAGLRAGIPNIVIPHTADQPFWGSKIYAIGAGPKPLPIRKLSVENLTRAIVESNVDRIRKRVQAVAQNLSREDGVKNAAALIEDYSNDFLRKNV